MPVLLVQNEVGTLMIVPVVGNSDFLLVFMDIEGDNTEYPPFYIPVQFLKDYAGGLHAAS